MTATANLRMRAGALTDEVKRKLHEHDGQVSGTIDEIRREFGMTCSNNEIRTALAILWHSGWIAGKPLDSLSIGLPSKKYLYRTLVNPEKVLLYRLHHGRIDRCGTAADFIEILGLRGIVTPYEFDVIIKGLIDDGIIKAPITQLANHANRQTLDVYLYLKLA